MILATGAQTLISGMTLFKEGHLGFKHREKKMIIVIP